VFSNRIQNPFLVPAQELHVLKLLHAEVAEVCCLVAQAGIAADDLCFKVQRHDVSLVPIRIDDKLVRVTVDANQPFHTDAQARFLSYFPFTSLRYRLACVHTAARQAPLTVICAARKKDPTLLIEDRSRAAESDFPLPADPFTIKNLCHFDFPLLEVSQDYLVKQRKDRAYVTPC